MLHWPEAFAPAAKGVSYLELYLSFRATTGLEAPVNVAKTGQRWPEYRMKSPSTLKACDARAPHQELRVFEFSLVYLAKLVNHQLFPLNKTGQTNCLSLLGERKPRTGFQGRCMCRYPFEREILTHLLDSISRSKGHWGFDSVAGMKLAPLVSIPVSPLDSTHIPATVYDRFAKLKKSRRWSFHCPSCRFPVAATRWLTLYSFNLVIIYLLSWGVSLFVPFKFLLCLLSSPRRRHQSSVSRSPDSGRS